MLELNFTYPQEHNIELVVLGVRMSLVAVDKLGVVGKKSKMDIVSLHQVINRVFVLKYRYLGSFPSDCLALPPNDTFANLNTQPSKLQGEHCIMIANSRHRLYSVDSLGRPSFLKQLYK